jgi:hypothetical protein
VIERIRTRIRRIWIGHRKLTIAVGAIAIVAIVGAGLLVWLRPAQASPAASPSPSPTISATPFPTASPTESPTPSPSPTVDLNPTAIPSGWEYSDLDGVAAPADLAHRLPLAISIGDNIAARPQYGFSWASIVYQSYEEYSQTRYLMIFQEKTATSVGGVRSARPYFVRWAAEYKALYGHDGGDTRVRNIVIPSMAGFIYNMDAGSGGSCPYYRVPGREAPHNEFTNTADMIHCAAQSGYPATYQGPPSRPFVADTPAADLPESQSITIPYATVSVSYQYDPASDSYLRSLDGKLQLDPANQQQVIARNIVVMFQTVTPDYVDFGIPRVQVVNTGSGKAIVFKEGKAITGTWKKTSDTALTHYYDDSGTEIPFVRGQIFMQSVPPGTAVTYK